MNSKITRDLWVKIVHFWWLYMRFFTEVFSASLNACEPTFLTSYSFCGFCLLQCSWKAGQLMYMSSCLEPTSEKWRHSSPRRHEHKNFLWYLLRFLFFNKNSIFNWHVVVLAVQRDVSGDGIVFAAEAAVHTGAWSQSHTRLFLCFVVTQVHHRQLRQRLQHTHKKQLLAHKLKFITVNCNQNHDKLKKRVLKKALWKNRH